MSILGRLVAILLISFLALAPELAGVTGRFYDKCREREPSAVATPELAGALWEHSEAWTAA